MNGVAMVEGSACPGGDGPSGGDLVVSVGLDVNVKVLIARQTCWCLSKASLLMNKASWHISHKRSGVDSISPSIHTHRES